MPIVMNNQYRVWLKSSANMKLSYDASVLNITYEGLTNFQYFMEFDCDSIESLSKSWSNNIDAVVVHVPNGIAAENAVPGTNISTISICRLVLDKNYVKYYIEIGRTPNFYNMHYVNMLGEFNTYYDAYVLRKKETSPEVSLVSDKDKEKKIIKWVPLFEDSLSRTFRSKGPLVYIVRETSEVPDVEDDTLTTNEHYGASGSML